MDPALWLTFAGASLVLAVAPGPDNLFVLAQSAVYGARHLAVAKAVSGGRTRSTIQPLEGEARVAEIARMLGGTSLTSVVEQHARELLSRAKADAPNML